MKSIVIRRLLCAASVLAAAVLIGLVGGTAAWLLFWASLAVPLFSLAYRIAIGRRFRARLRAEEQSVVHGERIRCALVLVNSGALPVPEIRVRMLSGKIECGEAEIVCALSPGEVKELPFELLCRHCGEALIGADSIGVGDIFGLFEKQFRATDTIEVLPRRQQLQALIVAPPQETERRHAVRRHFGERVPDGQLRSYVRGDDVRRIHWKASALQGRLIVRNEVNEPKSEIILLPDARSTLPEGETGWLAEDSIVEGTLCIADYYLRHSVVIRVVPDRKRTVRIRSESDYSRLYRICSERFFSGTERPDELLERSVAENGTACAYILLTWEIDETLLRRVDHCIRLGAEVTVIYVGDSAEAGSMAAAVRRLPFYQVTAQQDIFAVLGGTAGEGGAS